MHCRFGKIVFLKFKQQRISTFKEYVENILKIFLNKIYCTELSKYIEFDTL